MDNKNLISELSDEQIDALLTYVPLFEEQNKENIKAIAFEKISNNRANNKRFSYKKSALSALIAVAILVSSSLVVAAALGVDLGQIFNSFFNPEVANVIDVEQIAEQEGIEIKLISAYSDGSQAYAMLEMKDRKGNRLSDNMKLLFRNSNYNAYLCTPIAYDKVENKAVFGIKIICHQEIEVGDLVPFNVEKVLLDVDAIQARPINFPLYSLALEKEVISYQQWEEAASDGDIESTGAIAVSDEVNIEEIGFLKLDEITATLPGVDWAVVTNIGYVDGLLHIQLKRTDAYNFDYNFGSLLLQDSSGGEVTPLLDVEKGNYQELVFKVGSIEKLKNMKLTNTGLNAKTVISGPWNLDFTIKSQATKKFLTINLIDSPYFKQLDIECSPMATYIRFYAKEQTGELEDVIKMGDYVGAFDEPYLTLKDGSEIKLLVESNMFDNVGGTADYNSPYFQLSELKSITVCGVDYNFE